MEEKEFEAKLNVNEVKTDQIKKMWQICAFYAFYFGCSDRISYLCIGFVTC